MRHERFAIFLFAIVGLLAGSCYSADDSSNDIPAKGDAGDMTLDLDEAKDDDHANFHDVDDDSDDDAEEVVEADTKLIDDMEANTGRILDIGGRVGVWYAFNDESSGSSQWPSPTEPGVPIETDAIPPQMSDGIEGSTRAMHTHGEGHEMWGAGIGFDLAFDGEVYRSYDASAYQGIRFWARGDAPCLWLRIHTLETTYVEWGGTCEFDYCTEFAVKLDLEDHWREFEITFEEFRLERRWNDFSELDPDQLNELTNIQFFVPPSDSPNHTSSMFDYQCYTDDPFDFWVDDVSFF